MGVLLAILASLASTQSGGMQPDKSIAPPPVVWVGRQSRATIDITPENVELTEAGRFDLDPEILAGIAIPSDFTLDQKFTVKVWFAPTGGKPLRCETNSPSPTDLSKTVCERIAQSARFTFYPGFAQPLERGFVVLQVFHWAMPGKPPPIYAEVKPSYFGSDLRYAPDTTPETARIVDGEGALEVSITADDYPATALRNEITGRSTVLLGISSDGRVASCRPVQSTGAAVLDNATCALFVRRGRFRFAPTAKPYSGLRYRTRSMVWTFPNN